MLKSDPFLERYRPGCLDDVAGNHLAKRMLRNWLTRMGIPRTVLFCGESGSGKTTLARILAAAAVCLNRNPEHPEPCGRDDCPCSRLLREPIMFGRGTTCRNGVDMTVDDVKYDFRELYYGEPDAPIIIFYDEIHRAPQKVRDILLTLVEKYQDDYNFVLMASTWATNELEHAFINRFLRVTTSAPTETEMLSLLRRICEKESFPFDDETLLNICRDECCVPRNCIVTLWDRASQL